MIGNTTKNTSSTLDLEMKINVKSLWTGRLPIPVIFFSDCPQLSLLLSLFSIFLSFQTALFLLPQKVCVAEQSAEDKEDADQHPGADGGHPLHIWRVRRHDVEDVDEHEEEGDQHGHPAGDNLGGDEEADPGDHHEQARGQIVDVEIL